MNAKKLLSLLLALVMTLAASSCCALSLYTATPQSGVLVQTLTEGPEGAQDLVDALIASGALPPQVKVASFSALDGQGRLDLSAEFAQALNAADQAGESAMMGGLVNTFLDAFGLTDLMVTCQGQVLTGHGAYDKPLTRYQVGDTAYLRLQGNMTTGYAWTAAVVTGADVVKIAGEDYVLDDSDLMGAGGTQVFLIEALGPGTATVSLTYQRPWEEGVAPAQSHMYLAQVTQDNQLTLKLLDQEQA